MTLAQLLNQGAARLENISDSPTLDAEVLLAWTLDLDRTTLLQHAPDRVSESVQRFFAHLLVVRRRGVPVAYLTGRQAFMDFELAVTPHTLIPRPFTETLVAHLLPQLRDDRHVVADIGTGSGAIALALAKHAPTAKIIATDVSVPAVRVAARNARRLHLLRRVDFRVGSLLTPLRPDDAVTVVIANLPYLPTADLGERSIQHEPPLALHGGADGLVLIEKLLRQLRFLTTIKTVALELLPHQADPVAYLLRRQQFQVEPITDRQSTRGLIGRK